MKNFKTTLLGGAVAFTLNVSGIAYALIDQPAEAEKEKCAGEAYDSATTKLDLKLKDQGCQGQIYPAAYFATYAPRTALDMVSQIPGFQISSGNNGQRGMGNGGANILINGDKISGKTNPRDQLSRINAKNVVSIKIVDGTALGIPGLSGPVANMTIKNTGVSGTWEWNPEFRNRVKANLLSAKATISGETGNLGWSFTAQNEPFRNGNRGPETLTFADGTLFETRYEDGQYYRDAPGVSADFTWKPKEEHVANLNLKYNQINFNGRETSKRTAVTSDGMTQETLFSNAEDEWNTTVDADYEFPFLKPTQNGKLKLIGYYRFEHSPTVSRFDAFHPTQGLTTSERFFRVADEAELIGRVEYSWKPASDRDWQFSAEGAFNYLDIESQFVQMNTLPDNPDASRVEEKRAEASLTHSRQLSPKWDVQISGSVEYSEINQVITPDITMMSDPEIVRDFIRPKGFISATYKPDDSLKITTKIEREVGQLNFFDFISAVSLQDNLNTTGNSDLVPQQSWNGEIEFDKSFGDGNTFKATVYGELISDRVDRIPIGVDGDGVGNIDKASRYGINLSASLKGDKWGYKGTQLDLQLNLRNSKIEDPLRFFDRRLNNDLKHYWSAEFRHDIPKTDWAWGFFADQWRDSPNYRISTINDFNFAGPWGSVFIEHKDVFGLKVKLQAANLFDASDDFRREIYTDPNNPDPFAIVRRDIGVLGYTEDRTREFDTIYRLEVSGTF